MELTFTVLKYLAIVIAAGSAIWATLRQLTRDDGSGRRQLTRAGRVALSLLLLGFFVSLASNYIQQELASRSARNSAEREAERTREIILSGTPLRRLEMSWTFSDVPAELREEAKKAAGTPPKAPCAGDPFGIRDPQRRYGLYPLLASLPSGHWRDDPAILLLSLDESAGSVLPLGTLDLQQPDDGFSKYWSRASKKRVAATIEFRADLEQCVDLQATYPIPPVVDRPRRCELQTGLDFRDSGLTLRWDLNPLCIATGVDRADSLVVPAAQFPDRIVLLRLTDIGDLPFDPENFAQGEYWLPWNDSTLQAEGFEDRSHLKLVANGLTDDGAVYDVRFYGTRLMGGKSGGAEVQHDYPLLSIWVGEKRQE